MNDHDAALPVAPERLAAVPLAGRLVTGDALPCQRSLRRPIGERGGHYLVIVKENQPTLFADLALLCAAPPPGQCFASARQRGRHGDRQDVRPLWTSRALRGSLDGPGVEQVCRVDRVRTQKGKQTRATRYAITSLPARAGAPVLLRFVRGHWSIENRRHYVRAVRLGEDAGQVRTGAAPEVRAALRNLVLALLRNAGCRNSAAALRHHGWPPGSGLRLLGSQL